MIELRNVSYRRGNALLLDGIEASLPQGELTVVIGPNGAGKSTLLQCMARGIEPTQGELLFAGAPLAGFSWRDLARQRAVLSQQIDLPFPQNAVDVVQLARISHGSSPHDDRAIVEHALRRAGVFHLAARDIQTLSGGERQRVHIARVLAQLWESIEASLPALLLLDEPVSALDLLHQRELLSLLRTLTARGLTVCCVLHDLNLAALYADSIWVMRQGRLHARGSRDEIVQADLLSAIYGVELLTLPHPQLPDRRIVAFAES